MGELPTGTVTLLFSDIEGSTLLLSRLGPAYVDALDGQRAVLRSAWAAHGGTELGTEGDSFFVAFATAENAVAAAAQAQRELAASSWPAGEQVRVRMGIHTGSPQVHDGGYVGMDVHRAARIAGSAHGGQVVVSETTSTLVAGCLPGGVDLRDLGSHRLKDIAVPERLSQLVIEGVPAEFPALKSLGAASSLPVPPTVLVGRDAELAELAALLTSSDVRLLTLTGPGGSGKTRLAIELARRLVEAFPDGVHFVGLDAASTAAAMWSRIAETLAVPVEQRTPAGLFAQLAHRTALVVLDNLEQIPTADTAVAELLERAPALTLIATTRSPLHLAGEHQHAVPTLQLPTGQDLDALQRSAAVQLFVHLVAQVHEGFSLTADNAADVAEICSRLDGLPLALELAAARAKLLSPHALLSRLDKVLELRAPGTVDRPARQHVLRDTIAWSYELLTPQQQAFFRRLAVFAGGAELDAVTAVAGDLLPGDGDAVDPIAELLDASLLIISDTADGEPRIRLLETIRAYARAELETAGELDRTRDRHAYHCQGLAAQLFADLDGPDYLSVRARIDLELDNLRAALAWRLGPLDSDRPCSAPQVRAALQTARDCSILLGAAGHPVEKRRWLERAVQLGATAETVELARCQAALADTMAFQGDLPQAHDMATAALGLARRTKDVEAELHALMALAFANGELGRQDLARSEMEQAVALARTPGREWWLSTTLTALGDFEYREGRIGRAIEMLSEVRDLTQKQGHVLNLVYAKVFLAELQWRKASTPATRRGVLDLASEVLEVGDSLVKIQQAEISAGVLAHLDGAHAARLVGAADGERNRTGLTTRFANDQAALDDDLEPARAAMAPDLWEHHYRIGFSMSIEKALAEVAAGGGRRAGEHASAVDGPAPVT